ncbi:hypothetical protein KL918_003194 [Ogataea parapolymorpha]|uniref:Uncharacterized protein n=1 Tax=Ogataea parapolymorpha (strain ATCC 26012 / BCRC 20466 / JCM 22074 / NRRL Y-7560 / DL-1) TaxID=871575 RepID=W1QBN5_OGAPD|nr:hypothetical protein HPODL_01895 [Ogataea parapolymorpha DL-1]ESW97814.1 hypothetical protein HPODL_01895 [Ogataea parapolymorpha DL-1]KAG7866999.1 hypothetical protein KL918_003194 [Ogataea parapolymorpha]KAG7872363.1 hypothetical protein KL916_003098 [Ogataea parapolymorpha]
MQGYGKKYDLPRPYSMTPKRHGVDMLPRNYFTTPQRKLLGYIIFFILFSLVILQCIPEQERDKDYELDLGEAPEMKLVKDNDVVKKGSAKRPLDDDYSADYDELLNELEAKKASSKNPKNRAANEKELMGELTEDDLIDDSVPV